jgi:hypothetical protein
MRHEVLISVKMSAAVWVLTWVITEVSEEHSAFIFRVEVGCGKVIFRNTGKTGLRSKKIGRFPFPLT